MIRFAHSEWENSMVLQNDMISTIVIESPGKLFQYITQLTAQLNGEAGPFMLAAGGTALAFPAICETVFDFTTLDINNKKIVSLLHKKIVKEIQTTPLLFSVHSALSSLQLVLEESLEQFFVPVTFADASDVEVGAILKLFDVKMKDDATTLIEKLVDYIDVIMELSTRKVLFLLFAKSFLSEEDLMALHKHCSYHQLCLILLESQNYRQRLPNEQILIIDEDFCEVFVKVDDS